MSDYCQERINKITNIKLSKELGQELNNQNFPDWNFKVKVSLNGCTKVGCQMYTNKSVLIDRLEITRKYNEHEQVYSSMIKFDGQKLKVN